MPSLRQGFCPGHAAIRSELEKIGRKMGPHDFELAGQVLALDVTLVSRNLREFRRVGGLRAEDWEGA